MQVPEFGFFCPPRNPSLLVPAFGNLQACRDVYHVQNAKD